jgi:hypothetical protein
MSLVRTETICLWHKDCHGRSHLFLVTLNRTRQAWGGEETRNNNKRKKQCYSLASEALEVAVLQAPPLAKSPLDQDAQSHPCIRVHDSRWRGRASPNSMVLRSHERAEDSLVTSPMIIGAQMSADWHDDTGAVDLRSQGSFPQTRLNV